MGKQILEKKTIRDNKEESVDASEEDEYTPQYDSEGSHVSQNAGRHPNNANSTASRKFRWFAAKLEKIVKEILREKIRKANSQTVRKEYRKSIYGIDQMFQRKKIERKTRKSRKRRNGHYQYDSCVVNLYENVYLKYKKKWTKGEIYKLEFGSEKKTQEDWDQEYIRMVSRYNAKIDAKRDEKGRKKRSKKNLQKRTKKKASNPKIISEVAIKESILGQFEQEVIEKIRQSKLGSSQENMDFSTKCAANRGHQQACSLLQSLIFYENEDNEKVEIDILEDSNGDNRNLPALPLESQSSERTPTSLELREGNGID